MRFCVIGGAALIGAWAGPPISLIGSPPTICIFRAIPAPCSFQILAQPSLHLLHSDADLLTCRRFHFNTLAAGPARRTSFNAPRWPRRVMSPHEVSQFCELLAAQHIVAVHVEPPEERLQCTLRRSYRPRRHAGKFGGTTFAATTLPRRPRRSVAFAIPSIIAPALSISHAFVG
jgi:hypothetical protein